ncbi:MAG: hypothetical protein ACPG7F_01215 [Aggregatilineales bacterium]
MSFIKSIIVLLLLCLTLSIIAQETDPEAPFIYYYSHIYNGWIIERADGTDGYLFGVDVIEKMPGSGIDYHSWSPSGNWLMWIGGGSYTVEKQLHFARVDGTSEYSLPVNMAYPSESILIWSPYGDYLMVLQDRYQSQYAKILNIETSEYIFEIESEGVVSTKWTANGIFVHDNQYVAAPETLELYEFTPDGDFKLTASVEEGETECLEYIHHISSSQQSIYYCQKFDFEELSYIRIEDVSGNSTQIAAPGNQHKFIWSADGDYAYVADRRDHTAGNMQILSVANAMLKEFEGYGVQILKPDYDMTPYYIFPDLWLRDTNFLLYQTADELCLHDVGHNEVTCLPEVENGTDYILEHWTENFVYAYGEQYVTQYDFLSEEVVTLMAFSEPPYYIEKDVSADERYIAYLGECDGIYSSFCIFDRVQNHHMPVYHHSGIHYDPGRPLNIRWLENTNWLLMSQDANGGEGIYLMYHMVNAESLEYRELTDGNNTFGGLLPEFVNIDFITETDTVLQKQPLRRVLPEINGYDMVIDLDWSTDGQKIITFQNDGMVQVYDAKTAELLNRFDIQIDRIEVLSHYAFDNLIFLYDNHHDFYVRLPEQTVWFGNTLTGDNSGTAHAENDVIGFTISRDHSTMAYAYANGQILVQQRDYSVTLNDISETPILDRKVELSTNGEILAVFMPGDTIKVWNTQSSELLLSIPHEDFLKNRGNMMISPDGRQLVYSIDWIEDETGSRMQRVETHVTDIASGDVIAVLPSYHMKDVFSFSPDGRLLAHSSSYTLGSIITFYDTETYEVVDKYYGGAHNFAWSPDGSRFATASSTGFFIWETPGYEGSAASFGDDE